MPSMNEPSLYTSKDDNSGAQSQYLKIVDFGAEYFSIAAKQHGRCAIVD